MIVENIRQEKLLEFEPEKGIIRFAGQRALIWNAAAIGLFRQYLVQNFGLISARSILTQFGFSQGWSMAVATKKKFNSLNMEQRLKTDFDMHSFQGLFQTTQDGANPLAIEGMRITASFEAEQHILHFGRRDSAVCWTICGLLSGYYSYTSGKKIIILEGKCMAEGHDFCQLIGKTREEWGDQRRDDIAFYDSKDLKKCLDIPLARVMESLNSLEKENSAHRQGMAKVVPDINNPLEITVQSPKMKDLVMLAHRISKVDVSVLITGSSGSGKERIARYIHDCSIRSRKPFIAVNCGAISEALIESELFGHKRGSFTGAISDRIGLFEAADGGTLLLDEIGDMPFNMQVKLLRVLQEKEIRRVGENHNRPIYVRVLAATNRDLDKEVSKGLFRSDLYYRLKIVELKVPNLKDRKEDILPLADLMLGDAALRMDKKITGFNADTMEKLYNYDWPGNVRELENAIERSVALAFGSKVNVNDLPEEIRNLGSVKQRIRTESVKSLQDIEKEYILAIMKKNGGNQTSSANELKIGFSTLFRKLKKYNV